MFLVTSSFKLFNIFPPERTNKAVEVVFLFDGSASLDEIEFNKNKDFIVEIMGSLRDTPVTVIIQLIKLFIFAAVQFSSTVHKVFDFNDYAAGRALDKLMKEKHLKSLTNTHRGSIQLLDNEHCICASPDVTKVLILITDGDPSDTDRRGIIKRYDDKNITRLVVGVGCDVLHQSQQKKHHVVSLSTNSSADFSSQSSFYFPC
uniref:VWFA domain-containing protein n=1 Tax=Oreochromis aureus TaxID=47969 RepID=A0AAZ1XFC1_OREAU